MKSGEVMGKVLQPYPGLRPFQQHEADVFFGRGEQIDELLATLEDNNVVAVVVRQRVGQIFAGPGRSIAGARVRLPVRRGP